MNGEKKVKEGQILTNKIITQSNKNPDDGLTFEDRFVIIIKDVKLRQGQKKKADIKIDRVLENCAFGSLLFDE